METSMKMKCAKCGKPIGDVIPFCMDCAGYQPVAFVTSGSYLIVTYKRDPPPPSMWREK